MASERNLGPTFIGIGAMKCGTTWLSECLRYHPDIFMSIPKEIDFFGSKLNWSKGTEWYLTHFKDSKRYKARGEFSTSYLRKSIHAAPQIRNILGQVKIIALLRNPVARFISHYKQFIRDGKLLQREYNTLDIDTFHKATYLYPQLIDNGHYYENLKIFIEIFAVENVYIGIKEDIDKSPKDELIKIYNFLEVNHEYIPPIFNKKIGPGIIPRFHSLEALRGRLFYTLNERTPWLVGHIRRLRLAEIYRKLNADRRPSSFQIDERVIEKLASHYREEIMNVKRLVGRELDAWKQ